jgi:tetratricopeptide (TPR) repeat protein
MYDYNDNPEGLNVNELVLQYEGMLASGNTVFLDSDAFQDLIDYYEEQFEYPKALQAIEHALVNYPFSAVFHIRKAQLLLEEDRIDDANSALNFAKLYEPTNVDVILTEVEILHQSLDFDAALDMLDNALDFADKNDLEDVYMLEASIHESREDYEASFKSLVKVLRYNPNNEMAYSRLWMCMELTENYEAGINTSLEIIDREPYSYWAWYNLGHAYTHLGLYEKALEAYDYTIVINEHFEFAYRDVIACLFRLENFELAKRYVEDYKAIFEADAEVMLWEGECYEYSGEFEKARKIYAEALKRDQMDGRLHYRIGVCYASEEKWKAALKALESAYRQNKESEEFCIALAEVYNQLDETELAYTFYKKAIIIAPEEPITWISYLEFLIDNEDYEVAFETLEDARKYSNDILFDFCEVALNYLNGHRQEAKIQLILLLEDGHNASKLFEIAPELEEDAEIKKIIFSFSNNN